MAPQSANLFFSYVDSMVLGRQFTIAEFWKFVLSPIEEAMGNAITPLSDAYRSCIQQDCHSLILERFFDELFLSGKKLVLLIDEFDAFLENEIYNQTEFYGGLRSLASRSQGFAIIIASRLSLRKLNSETRQLNRIGSPYFNFLDEIPLRPFSKERVDQILGLSGHFSADDRKFIHDLAGGHPYFVQALASELWEIYEDRNIGDPIERRTLATEEFYAIANATLEDIWRLWTPQMQKAFITIVLDEMPRTLGDLNIEFYIRDLLKKLPTYVPELKELKRRGFIKEDRSLESHYCVTAQVMSQFIADELVKALREAWGDNDKTLGAYFNESEWRRLLTVGEKKQIVTVAKSFYNIFKEGVDIYGKLAGK